MIVKGNMKRHEEVIYETYEILAATVTKDYLGKRGIFWGLQNTFITGTDFNAKHTNWRFKLITTKYKELYCQ